MRWRIPLVLTLALFVTVSCDQQPTQPLEQEAAAVPVLFDSKGADVFKSGFKFDFNLCGYTDVSCEVTEHVVFRSAEDASGGSHYFWRNNWRGTCVSDETGETWRLQDDAMEKQQWQESGQETYQFTYISAGVGNGHAPNFKARIRCQYVVNANGVPVVDRCTEFICEEFGN